MKEILITFFSPVGWAHLTTILRIQRRNMQVSGREESLMARVYAHGEMGPHTLVVTAMEKSKVQASISFLPKSIMKAIGLKECSMAKALCMTKMGRYQKKEFG